MLPNRFQLSEKMDEKLKREKNYTGLSPNVASRILFFISIENQRKIDERKIDNLVTGKTSLDKAVWLGASQTVTELILQELYPKKSSDEYAKIWALHVEDGYQISMTGTNSL